MQVGDRVQWTSQSSGSPMTKHGTIIAVVPAGEYPNRFLPKGEEAPRSGFGGPRSHNSYLVKVDGHKPIYWPRVKYLRPELS